jgi:hypothetical protein
VGILDNLFNSTNSAEFAPFELKGEGLFADMLTQRVNSLGKAVDLSFVGAQAIIDAENRQTHIQNLTYKSDTLGAVILEEVDTLPESNANVDSQPITANVVPLRKPYEDPAEVQIGKARQLVETSHQLRKAA